MLIIYITVFILGSLWGSFSNVCIYRLPEGGNIVSSRSACRNCQKKINWFDNIPFISFIILRGKCRNCECKISFQYFFVELLVGLGFLVSFYFFGFTIKQNPTPQLNVWSICSSDIPFFLSQLKKNLSFIIECFNISA